MPGGGLYLSHANLPDDEVSHAPRLPAQRPQRHGLLARAPHGARAARLVYPPAGLRRGQCVAVVPLLLLPVAVMVALRHHGLALAADHHAGLGPGASAARVAGVDAAVAPGP
ncbi:hypothetical protein CBM2587_A260020 [Cupriavidus taiwanensis]|uniref:Uncharacterized protein n=1 Tax=Cupriavidus taiwanensis TaxID=164546 RepID=A0A976A1K4_9BURK|nr:hypothetical protein CBM2587_A260020 [Cupriavidus taiwanensis]